MPLNQDNPLSLNATGTAYNLGKALALPSVTDTAGKLFIPPRVMKHSGCIKVSNHLSSSAPLVVAADTTLFRRHTVPGVNQSTFTLILENYGATDIVYDNVSVRVAGNGAQNSNLQLTKNGSTTITVPAASVAATTSGNTSQSVPGLLELDLPINNSADNQMTSVPTNAPFSIYVRCHTTSGGTVQITNDDGDALFSEGSGSIAGDYITTWPTVTYLTTNYPQFSALRIRAKSKVITVMGIGDSHVASEGWFAAAVAYANTQVTDRTMLYWKQAYGGVGSAVFKNWANAFIPVVKPDYVYIPWGTFNDGGSSTIPTSRQNIRAIIDLCESLDIGIITSTPHPLDGNAAGSFITRTNAIADEIRASYADYVDVYALTGNSATATYLAGMSTDGTHLNATGVATVQPYFNTLFTNILKRGV